MHASNARRSERTRVLSQSRRTYLTYLSMVRECYSREVQVRYGRECHVGALTFGILAKPLVNILVVRIWDFVNLEIWE